MSHHPVVPTDDAIEAGIARRAPHGPGPVLLPTIMTAVANTPQGSRWPVEPGLRGRELRRRAVWIAIAAVLVTMATAALLGGFGSRPTLPGLTSDASPVASPDASPAATPSAPALAAATASPTVCATDTIVATPGSLRPEVDPRATFAGLDAGQAAYLTEKDMAEIDVWTVAGADAPPRLAAALRGQGINMAGIAGWALGGRSLLIWIGHSSPSGASRECGDLYLVAADGSGVQRITHNTVDQSVLTASASVDGRRLAFSSTTGRPAPDGPAVANRWLDVADLQPHELSAGLCLGRMVWSPDGARVATSCGAEVGVIDLATGTVAAVTPDPASNPLATVWTPAGDLLVATAQAPLDGGLTIWRVDPEQATATPVAHSLDETVDWTHAMTAAFSPDGSRLMGTLDGGDLSGPTWVLDVASGRLTRVIAADRNSIAATASWTDDGNAILYLDLSDWDRPTIFRQPVDGHRASIVGVLPAWSPSINGPTWVVRLP